MTMDDMARACRAGCSTFGMVRGSVLAIFTTACLAIMVELKEWSLVDATSFNIMTQCGIHETLATDLDFVQAGFIKLL